MKKGRVVRPVLESKLLQGNPLGDPIDRVTPVYLPPSYDESDSRRYPLILAIVGFTGTGRMHLNEEWFEPSLPDRIDTLIDSGEMNEAIVVMPDGSTRYAGSQYIDSAATGPYGRYTGVEVIEWADREFRTIPKREARGVFGKSSGGFGSFRMAVDFPEVFSAFACHSGDSAFEYCYLREFPHALRYLWQKNITPKRFLETYRTTTDRSGDFMALLNELAMASCYSASPGSELGFDLPFDVKTGALVDDVWERWLAEDPVRMIPRRLAIALADLPRLRNEGRVVPRRRHAPDGGADAGPRPRGRPRGIRRRAHGDPVPLQPVAAADLQSDRRAGRLTPAAREVLIVLRARPAPAPCPSDGTESTHHRAAGPDEAARVRGAVEVRGPRGGLDRPAGHIRILHGIDVDRAAVGVFGPSARVARAAAAVEGRRVVRLHRSLVVAAVHVDEAHPLDREACLEQLSERRDDVRSDVFVHDELARVYASVETPEAQTKEPQIVETDWTTGSPRGRHA
jgi:hypothetical protein